MNHTRKNLHALLKYQQVRELLFYTTHTVGVIGLSVHSEKPSGFLTFLPFLGQDAKM